MHSLARVLEQHVLRMSAKIKKVQRCRTERLGADTVLHFLDSAPIMNASECTHISVADSGDAIVRTIPAPIHPHPFSDQLPAGLYRMSATIDPPTPPFVSRQRLVNVVPRNPKLVIGVT